MWFIVCQPSISAQNFCTFPSRKLKDSKIKRNLKLSHLYSLAWYNIFLETSLNNCDCSCGSLNGINIFIICKKTGNNVLDRVETYRQLLLLVASI